MPQCKRCQGLYLYEPWRYGHPALRCAACGHIVLGPIHVAMPRVPAPDAWEVAARKVNSKLAAAWVGRRARDNSVTCRHERLTRDEGAPRPVRCLDCNKSWRRECDARAVVARRELRERMRREGTL